MRKIPKERIRAMKKPVPEDFGLTDQEYSRLVAESNQLRKALNSQPSYGHWIEVLMLSLVSAFFLGFFAGAAGLGVLIVLGELEIQVGKSGFTILLVVAIIGASYGLVAVLIEPNRERRRRVQYREQLAAPKYHNVEQYEDALRGYDHRQQGYWKSLRGTEFEIALTRLYKDMGYSVRQTKASGDEGVDLILVKEGMETIVQCKGHEKPIGVGAVRDLYGTMMHFGAESAVLASPAGFTEGVMQFVTDKPIQLVSARELVEMAESVCQEE